MPTVPPSELRLGDTQTAMTTRRIVLLKRNEDDTATIVEWSDGTRERLKDSANPVVTID